MGEDLFQVTNTTAGADAAKSTAHYKYTAANTWTLSDATGAAATAETPYMMWAKGDNTFEAYMPLGMGSSYTTFTLPSDQSNVARLRSADWMTATVTKARTDADRSIKLAFAHKLAKVTVKIAAYRNEFGSTPPALDKVTFNLPTIDHLKGVTLTTAAGITPFVTADQSAAALHSYTAILIPGKYIGSDAFVTMNVNGQAISTKANELLTGKGLEGGKSYTFELSVGKDIVTINSFTVAEWTTGEDLTASAAVGLKIAAETGANGFPIYEIYTAEGLKAFADLCNGTDDGNPRTFCGINIPGSLIIDNLNNNVRLMADIDLSSVCSKALGKNWRPISNYEGVFEGNLHAVKGLYIDDTRVNYLPSSSGAPSSIPVGLFGVLSDATVRNLTVEGSINFSVSAPQSQLDIVLSAGGIAGFNFNSLITGCHSAVNISVEGEAGTVNITVNAGGIVGDVSVYSNISLNDCSSTGSVSGTASSEGTAYAWVGGICGSAHGSENITLTGCSHTVGALSATTLNGETNVGGIVGFLASSGQLLGCTNTAEVKGSAAGTDANSWLYIGGVIGNSKGAEVIACSNSGAIFYNAGNYLCAGGVAGHSSKSIVASFTTKIPTLSQGGSSGAQGTSYIGGVLGTTTASAVSTCFYAGGNDLGTNGIGESSTTTNTDGGRVADLTTINNKVKAMNTTITTYNTANPDQGCPYRWIQTPDGPQARK